MDWNSISHLLHMDGHGVYVWTVYGVAVLLAAAEIFGLRKRRAKAMTSLVREARAMRETREN